MHLRRRAVVGALAMAFLAGACSEYDNGNNTLSERDPSPTAPGGPQTTGPAQEPGGPIKLDAANNAFNPKTIEAKAGDVTIEMTSSDTAPHTFTNADLKVDVNVDAGKTGTIELTGLAAGTYKFVCKYHEAAGMVGELKVT